MRNAHGRRLAMRRPKLSEVEAMQVELDLLEREEPQSEELRSKIIALKEKLAWANARRKWIGFIDPVDVRYNSFAEQPVPTSQASRTNTQSAGRPANTAAARTVVGGSLNR